MESKTHKLGIPVAIVAGAFIASALIETAPKAT